MSMFGRRFGTRTVIAGAPLNTAGRTQFVCRCDCGLDSVIGQHLLLRGQQAQCEHTGFTTGRVTEKYDGASSFGRSAWKRSKESLA